MGKRGGGWSGVGAYFGSPSQGLPPWVFRGKDGQSDWEALVFFLHAILRKGSIGWFALGASNYALVFMLFGISWRSKNLQVQARFAAITVVHYFLRMCKNYLLLRVMQKELTPKQVVSPFHWK